MAESGLQAATGTCVLGRVLLTMFWESLGPLEVRKHTNPENRAKMGAFSYSAGGQVFFYLANHVMDYTIHSPTIF